MANLVKLSLQSAWTPAVRLTARWLDLGERVDVLMDSPSAGHGRHRAEPLPAPVLRRRAAFWPHRVGARPAGRPPAALHHAGGALRGRLRADRGRRGAGRRTARRRRSSTTRWRGPRSWRARPRPGSSTPSSGRWPPSWRGRRRPGRSRRPTCLPTTSPIPNGLSGGGLRSSGRGPRAGSSNGTRRRRPLHARWRDPSRPAPEWLAAQRVEGLLRGPLGALAGDRPAPRRGLALPAGPGYPPCGGASRAEGRRDGARPLRGARAARASSSRTPSASGRIVAMDLPASAHRPAEGEPLADRGGRAPRSSRRTCCRAARPS